MYNASSGYSRWALVAQREGEKFIDNQEVTEREREREREREFIRNDIFILHARGGGGVQKRAILFKSLLFKVNHDLFWLFIRKET